MSVIGAVVCQLRISRSSAVRQEPRACADAFHCAAGNEIWRFSRPTFALDAVNAQLTQ